MDQSRHSGRITKLGVAVGCIAGGLIAGLLYVKLQAPARMQPAPAPQTTESSLECTKIGSTCLRFGRTGECVQNRCILGGGLCSQHVDCDDENPCTIDRCHLGVCEQVPRMGGCTRGNNEPGKCSDGACDEVLDAPSACTTDADCPQSSHPCQVLRCESGVCIRRRREEGESCQVASGRAGACSQGACVFGLDQTERCKVVWDSYWGAQKVCSKALSFTMEPDEIATAERKIAKELQTELLYDMKVALVALPDGGYNVVTFNRRPRTDLHGMCDPSYIAWNVAFFTANSKWKSRVLQIWTKPYEEGWYVSTSGSRNAIRQGRANSGLGWLGVVHVPTFRKWLDKSFRPLPSVPFNEKAPTIDEPMHAASDIREPTAVPAQATATNAAVPLIEKEIPMRLDSGPSPAPALKPARQDSAIPSTPPKPNAIRLSICRPFSREIAHLYLHCARIPA